MSEFEKMKAGKLYSSGDKELALYREKAHNLCRLFNTLSENDPKRNDIVSEMLGYTPDNLSLMGPIYFDYGILTRFGKNCYANFSFTVLDCAPINIGDNVLFGPNCSLYTPVHPFLPEERNIYQDENGDYTDKEYAKPINIGSNCWIGGNVTILGGVNIGEGSIIGAGSLVNKDIPPHVIAAGNPCKVIKEITSLDSVYLKKDLF